MPPATTLAAVYGHSLALATDLYQLTMAQGYWKAGLDRDEAAFHLFFREEPFNGGYAIASGLEHVLDYVRQFRFTEDDLGYLAEVRGADDRPQFDPAFLNYLSQLRLACDVDAIPEGTLVFAHEPLLRVTGPLLHCQLLETVLLTLVNFQTLVASKAARVVLAAGGDGVVEFGLRRAQGLDGGLSASRAAYVGGCAATSNVLAGKLYGIPLRGTHAHSWIMCFDDERQAFQAYADAAPNNCLFLVDTYDTLAGVRNAVAVGRKLRERGHEMLGVRLDSGDLAALSIAARRILDDGGFPQADIVASNDLDEYQIEALKRAGAKITLWGVGTKLVTAYDQPALGGVYKLSAVRRPGEEWRYKLKLSEQELKTSNPGIQQVRRFHTVSGLLADCLYDVDRPPQEACIMVELRDGARREIPAGTRYEDLLVPVVRGGEVVYDPPPLAEVRRHAGRQVELLPAGVRQLRPSEAYPVGLDLRLDELKRRLIASLRGGGSGPRDV